MAIVKNYSFGNRFDPTLCYITGLKDYRSAKPKTFALFGNSYTGKRFTDGNLIVTSGVSQITDSLVITHSGTAYSIADIHPDYQDFLDAIDKNIPILYNWSLKGNLRHGYKISGNIQEKSVQLDILRQEDNNIFIVSDNDKNFSIFVDWTDSVHTKISMDIEGTDLDQFKDFESFCGINFRKPLLFPTK